MKVFISWSGPRSHYIAEALAEWLPDVIQAVEPFLSTNDIPKGTRWGTAVANELEGSSVGVVCLTPENLVAPWIHYEVGALSKMIAEARICTYLYDLQPGQLLSPLADFQATMTDKGDTFKMLFSINAALESQGLPTDKLQKAFEKWWSVLEEKLKRVPKTEEPSKVPSDREMLQEVLQLLRKSPPATVRRETRSCEGDLRILRRLDFLIDQKERDMLRWDGMRKMALEIELRDLKTERAAVKQRLDQEVTDSSSGQ
jgi:hypothetical protein